MGLVTSLCLAVERLEVLSTLRIAPKPKAAAKHEEVYRPKTATPKAVDKIAFKLVDGVASMKLRLTYVMKEGKKILTINAVARFSALEEKFRRRLRLSGINASVVSKGASGFEVVVPKDELEKLTPEESRKAVPRTRGAD